VLKITTILGTRPEVIRMANCIKLFDQVFQHRLIHTGQNQDPKLNAIFFSDLDVRKPDLYLQNPPGSFGSFIGHIFPQLEIDFSSHRPDAIVILGDTNSALVSIVAKRMRIPIYHLEAGNRSFDQNVPEEINRKIIDHTSDFNLAYTEHAKSNLLNEGLHPRFISVIGSPLREVILSQRDKISSSKILSEMKIQKDNYFLVSAHRQENIDDAPRLLLLLESLNQISEKYKIPIIVSTHPRLRDKIDKLNISNDAQIIFSEPFGFLDYLNLQINARLVISDSGSISEEAAILGFKAITIRDSIERPEAIEAGTIILSGIDPISVLSAMEMALLLDSHTSIPTEYLIGDTSLRVVKFIQSTLPQFKFWTGVRERS
jgi:UDP-N-acetylglucosamine 2-epimerase (non-hydrolysing)